MALHVVVLKAPTSSDDQYVHVLEAAGFRTTLVPALQFGTADCGLPEPCTAAGSCSSNSCVTSPDTTAPAAPGCDTDGKVAASVALQQMAPLPPAPPAALRAALVSRAADYCALAVTSRRAVMAVHGALTGSGGSSAAAETEAAAAETEAAAAETEAAAAGAEAAAAETEAAAAQTEAAAAGAAGAEVAAARAVWSQRPVFVVGPATGSCVRQLLGWRHVVGADSGSAAALAEAISRLWRHSVATRAQPQPLLPPSAAGAAGTEHSASSCSSSATDTAAVRCPVPSECRLEPTVVGQWAAAVACGRRLLLPVGSRFRRELLDGLRSCGIACDAVVAYTTAAHPQLEAGLLAAAAAAAAAAGGGGADTVAGCGDGGVSATAADGGDATAAGGGDATAAGEGYATAAGEGDATAAGGASCDTCSTAHCCRLVVVLFSPSAVEFAASCLRRLLAAPAAGRLPSLQLQLVAIGPTTAAAVVQLQLPLSATAQQPTPEALRDTLLALAQQ